MMAIGEDALASRAAVKTPIRSRKRKFEHRHSENAEPALPHRRGEVLEWIRRS
jgi:hypothetical protein